MVYQNTKDNTAIGNYLCSYSLGESDLLGAGEGGACQGCLLAEPRMEPEARQRAACAAATWRGFVNTTGGRPLSLPVSYGLATCSSSEAVCISLCGSGPQYGSPSGLPVSSSQAHRG